MLIFPLLFHVRCTPVVTAVRIELENRAGSRSNASFTPSSLPLYPLDFQDNWQAAQPIPVDVNFSVPHFGPRDLANHLEELSRSSGALTKQVRHDNSQLTLRQLNEREWQDQNIEAAEDRSAVLMPYPDLEFMPLQSLRVLASSMEKMKHGMAAPYNMPNLHADAVLRLHAIQKVNHDLLTENARLRHRTRDMLKRQKESAPLPARSRESWKQLESKLKPVNPAQAAAKAATDVCAPPNRTDPMSVDITMGPDFTAVVEMRIGLDAPQLRDFFQAEPTDFQYKLILIETKNGIVENASTVITRNPKVTLRKLQNDVVYHVTVHVTVPNAEYRLTKDAKFVYHQRHSPSPTPEPVAVTPQAVQPPINVGSAMYTLNVQVGEKDYATCAFADGDDFPVVARQFIQDNRLKPVLLEGLLQAMQQLRASGVTIRSVDVSDLI
ncbi:hypothetical protein, conserved [Babesia bigemina]|uniref:Uncharacterized protein n=1 Tax=Babesia bigemina TaxID=5866 RepID=A0A061D4N1_BABBI|nr:hypothetical protein, conserved [Babesia bigemina]CDR95007.1 hypothetical protein, conserved [Babesia bigemina]|eukprot:XP_012767193.1 hypothetical protein, conserved [Babesia bigemina]